MSSTDPRSTPTPDDGPDVAPAEATPTPVPTQATGTEPAGGTRSPEGTAEGVLDEDLDDSFDDDDLDDDPFDDEAFLDDPRFAGPGLAVRAGAEAAGSFVLVLATIGVALYTGISGVGALGTALAGGLALAAVTSTFGHVSGGGFIPAVTLASAIAGRTAWVDVLPYWLAQLVGAVTAGAVLFLTVPAELPALLGAQDARDFFGTAANQWGQESSLWVASAEQVSFDLRAALLVELVAAAVLAGVALAALGRRTVGGAASSAGGPLAVGAAFAVLAMVAAPVTGASLNPARSTAAALFADGAALGQLWLFWVAPLVGAAIAGLLHRAFAEPDPEVLVEEVVLLER